MTDLVNESLKRLHSQGGRMTSQRRLILEHLQDMADHPTAEELHEIVSEHDEAINLSTIYRTLRWLEQERLVSHYHFEDDPRNERFDSLVPGEHQHFICLGCKRVIEFDDPKINSVIASFENQNLAEVKTANLTLHGLCSDCK
jgi:Fe2+ or Zn2+ uptake regulation protein